MVITQFIDVDLKFVVVIANSHLQHILCMLIIEIIQSKRNELNLSQPLLATVIL